MAESNVNTMMAPPISLPAARPADRIERSAYAYSICTLVTDAAEYERMRASFAAAGFTTDCEFLYLDNTLENRFDAFTGVNLFLREARGHRVVLCHQDVHVIDGRQQLDSALADLDVLDPAWGLAGNAGGRSPGQLAIRITDPYVTDCRRGPFPARVYSLDENFIVVPRDARLAASRDLAGFHLYGTDLCLIADVLGWSAYVIDFHLHHFGGLLGGKKSGRGARRELAVAREQLFRKYARAFAARRIQTPSASIYISGSRRASVWRNKWTWRAIADRVRRRLRS